MMPLKSQSGSADTLSTRRAASSAVGRIGSGFRATSGNTVSTGFVPIQRHRTPRLIGAAEHEMDVGSVVDDNGWQTCGWHRPSQTCVVPRTITLVRVTFCVTR
jgi:hypothetical protein